MWKALELLAWEMYRRSALGSPYRPKVNWFWYCIWKWLAIRRQEVSDGD